MSNHQDENEKGVEHLIQAITSKLESNKSMLGKSVNFGRISWRKRKTGEIDIDIELKI